MAINLRARASIRCDADQNRLDVNLAFIGEGFSGKCEKTVNKNNLSVGLRADGVPVFIYIREAELLDGTFHDLLLRMLSREVPSEKHKAHILKRGLSLMRKIAEEYHRDQGNEWQQNLKEVVSAKNVRMELQTV